MDGGTVGMDSGEDGGPRTARGARDDSFCDCFHRETGPKDDRGFRAVAAASVKVCPVYRREADWNMRAAGWVNLSAGLAAERCILIDVIAG